MSPLSEKPVTAADKTFIQLRQDIVEGQITAGSKLSETELSTKYAVSRAIIREAINRLESSHLVERKANVGAKVVALTPEGLVQLYEVRESLEGMAARLAADQMTDQEITALQDLLNSYGDTVKSGETYYQEAGDVDFHYRIILGSKNTHLISLLIEGIYLKYPSCKTPNYFRVYEKVCELTFKTFHINIIPRRNEINKAQKLFFIYNIFDSHFNSLGICFPALHNFLETNLSSVSGPMVKV